MRVGNLPNVNSIKLNRGAKQETSVCSRNKRLKNNEQPSEKPKKTATNKTEKKTTSYTTVGLCLAGLRAIQSSEKRDVSAKPEAESFGINSTSSIHTVCATSTCFRENTGP